MLIGIVAMTENGLIGNGNKLPWHIPMDLEFFRAATLRGTLLCGKKTWEGLPPLADRKFILYTRNPSMEQTENLREVSTLDEVVDLVVSPEKYFLIGGAYMYQLFGSLCHSIFVTKVIEDDEHQFEGDAYFPVEILKKYNKVRTNPMTDRTTGTKLLFELYQKKEKQE